MAPLAKNAGGYGSCGNVFNSTQDSDYQTILRGLQDSKKYLDEIKRFNMPNFRPPTAYITEMKRYGILPPSHQQNDPIDVYATDKKYFESFWWKPLPDTSLVGIKRR